MDYNKRVAQELGGIRWTINYFKEIYAEISKQSGISARGKDSFSLSTKEREEIRKEVEEFLYGR